MYKMFRGEGRGTKLRETELHRGNKHSITMIVCGKKLFSCNNSVQKVRVADRIYDALQQYDVIYIATVIVSKYFE